MRTREAKKLVLREFARYAGRNFTQFYSVVNRVAGGEARVDVYACRRDNKTRKLLCKCVQRIWSNRDIIAVRDIWRISQMGGLSVDFSDLTPNCRNYGREFLTPEAHANNPGGRWDATKYEGLKTAWLLEARLVNDFNGTKYERSGIGLWGWNVAHFFACYRISPSVEFLVKAGLGRFVTPSFVRRLKTNKRLFAFFRQHVAELRANRNFGIREVNAAFAHGLSLTEAAERVHASDFFKGYCPHDAPLPEGISRVDIYKYCLAHEIPSYTYCRYIGLVAEAGEDMRAYGVAFPRDFPVAYERVESLVNAKKDARREQERERVEEALREVSVRLARLSGITGHGYAVVIPKTKQMLVDEGNAMHNCIGSMGYERRIAEGTSLIFFLRGEDGRKNVDVEVRIYKEADGRTSFKVVQCYAPCNAPAPKEARDFADELARKAKRILCRKAA